MKAFFDMQLRVLHTTSKRFPRLRRLLLAMVCLVSLRTLQAQSFFPPVYKYFNNNNPDTYADVRAFRNNQPHANSGRVPAEIAQGIFAQPAFFVEKLVQALVARIDHPLEKAKAIHDWIALNIPYDAESFLSKRYYLTDPLMTLLRRKAVCGGYATLFNHFCRLAGLRTEVVGGYSRGYGFNPLNETVGIPNHAWNAVQFQGNWYLVDVTWDAGYVRAGRFVKRYRTEFLFLPPEEFIKTHYPELPGWLLLPMEVARDSYPEVPYEQPILFDFDIDVLRPTNSHNPTPTPTTEVLIRNPRQVPLTLTLSGPSGREIRMHLQTDAEGMAKGQVKLQATGPTLVRLWVQTTHEPAWEMAAEYVFTLAPRKP